MATTRREIAESLRAAIDDTLGDRDREATSADLDDASAAVERTLERYRDRVAPALEPMTDEQLRIQKGGE